MSNLIDLVKQYTIQHDRTIRNVCAPLKDSLGISLFCYYTIEQDGRFGIISNYPQQLEFFYEQKLYLTNPYLKHPQLFRSGCALILPNPEPHYVEIIEKRFQVRDMFLMLQRRVTSVEGFLFAMQTESKDEIDYLHHIDILTKFGGYFKREIKPLIERMKRDEYNLKHAKGQPFFEADASVPLLSNDPNISQFLEAISPLSQREQQCLELFKEGHSAQATAAILELSQRTVEHYFESIKNKLDCSSKRDLLDL